MSNGDRLAHEKESGLIFVRQADKLLKTRITAPTLSLFSWFLKRTMCTVDSENLPILWLSIRPDGGHNGTFPICKVVAFKMKISLVQPLMGPKFAQPTRRPDWGSRPDGRR